MDERTGNGPAAAAESLAEGHGGERKDPLAHIAREIATYKARLPELLEHEGEYVLIKGDQIIGFFKSFEVGVSVGYREFGLVPFLVKQIHAVEPVIYIPNVVF